MNEPNTQSDLAQLELQYKQLLENLMDVYSARVSLDDNGDIVEVHVLANARRNVSAVMSDVRAALSAHFGANVDNELISVALLMQSPQEMAQAATPAVAQLPSRLRLGRLSQVLEDDRFEVSLTLKYAGQVFEGSAQSRNSGPQRNMCVANATLAAVHSYLGEDNVFTLSGVQRVAGMPVPMCMVMVQCNQPPSAMLVGTAEVSFDEASSVERATLNAVNRKLAAIVEAAEAR